MFKAATKHESSYPPKCCKPMTVEVVRGFLDPKIFQSYEAKKVEWDTKDRVYCFNIACRRFVPPSRICHGNAVCLECKKSTCVKCKRIIHSGSCDKDRGFNETLALMKNKGWQRCPTCETGVERMWGCNRIRYVLSNQLDTQTRLTNLDVCVEPRSATDVAVHL